MTNLKNLPASVKARLLDLSKVEKRAFNDLLRYYMMERFLYRLSVSPYAKKFVLKGANLLYVWAIDPQRTTLDIDLLGRTRNSEENLRKIFNSLLAIEVKDGVAFHHEDLEIAPIQHQADYRGLRLRFVGSLGKATVPMQIDIGFGDLIYPRAQALKYPTLLDFPAPDLLGYTPQSVVAEKYHAIVQHGIANSRMKDFYDLMILQQTFQFERESLAGALRKTFSTREATLSVEGLSILDVLGNDHRKNVLWDAFLKKIRSSHQLTFPEVCISITSFLKPVIERCER